MILFLVQHVRLYLDLCLRTRAVGMHHRNLRTSRVRERRSLLACQDCTILYSSRQRMAAADDHYSQNAPLSVQ